MLNKCMKNQICNVEFKFKQREEGKIVALSIHYDGDEKNKFEKSKFYQKKVA